MKNCFMVFSTLVFASALSAKPLEPVHSPSALFANFREMDEVFSISVPTFFINWHLSIARIFPKLNIGGAYSLIPPGLIQSAETIRVVHTYKDETAKQMKEMFGEFIDKSEFAEFVRSNEKRERALIYISS